MLRQPDHSSCPVPGGGSLWVEVEIPTDDPDIVPSTMTVELERGGQKLFAPEEAAHVRARFAAAGKACGASDAVQARKKADCKTYRAGVDHRALSNAIGQKSCAHPEAKDARALFCMYPPRFYGHQGICRQYSQFCPFQELQAETDPVRLESAVVNVDKAFFHALQECDVLKDEIWIFKVYVHWCPHCQQLMPRLYRLALVLMQHGAKRLRFGAVNCATEHELCAEQKWPGHPLLVPKYTGPDRRIHDAIEHWVEAVKDPQLREMLPRDAFPGEYPLIKVFLEQLPEEYAPKKAWELLFDEPEVGENGESGACPNLTALHPTTPGNIDEAVGNAWSDMEANFTVRHRWLDTMFILRHTFKEWIVPLSDDGGTTAFSYAQVQILERWVALLASNLPPAFQLAKVLVQLRGELRARLRAAQSLGGGRLCAEDWKALAAPVVKEIEAVGARDFAGGSACASDTCRMWSLLHTLAGEGLRREISERDSGRVLSAVASECSAGLAPTKPIPPSVLLTTVRDFLSEYFKCLYCRRHFLEQFDLGSYGLERARSNSSEVVLYLWRLHNAVSVRVVAEHGCDRADRRWPPLSVCPRCWDVMASDDWDVLSESAALQTSDGGGRAKAKPRPPGAAAARSPGALELRALPDEDEVLRFLMEAFSESPSAVAAPPPSEEGAAAEAPSLTNAAPSGEADQGAAGAAGAAAASA